MGELVRGVWILMENSVGKSGGGYEIVKKTKSLDIESLYKSSGGGESSKVSCNNKGKSRVVGNGDEVRNKKKRKSRKEVALSSFEPAGKKSRKCLDDSTRSVSGLESADLVGSGLSETLNGSSGGGLNGISLNLDGNGNGLCIPKRRRGSVGRNKFANNRVVKPSVSASSIGQSAKLKVEEKEVQHNEGSRKAELLESKAKSKVEHKEIQQNEASRKPEPPLSKANLNLDHKEVHRNDVSRKSEPSQGKAKSRVERKEVRQNDSSRKPEPSEGKVKSKVEQKGIQQNEVSGNPQPSESKIGAVAEVVKLSSGSGGKVVSPKVNRKTGLDDSKLNRRGKELAAVGSSQHGKREGGHLIVNNGDASSSKRLNNHRKRKVPTSGRETVAKKVVPSVDNVSSTLDVFQDDDEENLEQNAARMLSSRFDPSCTGFSSRSRSSASSSANGLSFLVSPTPKFGSRELGAGSESASADTASRVLRPRKQHKGKGLSRKRRHFYEILSRDLDAFWFLNRRIKVFWPLDESWYYGLVNDYDSETKLHHIKYDDRDEEWISLQTERFKLLLLPGEVPSKIMPKESATEACHPDTESRNLDTKDETFLGSHMESEPIISWLGRSSIRVKSSPSGSRKKQKTSHLPSNFLPAPPSDKSEDPGGNAGMGPLESETSNPNQSSTLPVGSTDGRKGEKSVLENTSRPKGGHLPVVYVRRRKKNACGSTPGAATSHTCVARSSQSSQKTDVSLGCSCSNELIWSLNNSGMLELSVAFRESKQFRFEVCLSLRPLLDYALDAEIFWLIHNVLLLRYGTIMITWPTVQLEVLFVDNVVGLRFFLFEGCLKQAVTFVFLVMTIFREPDKQGKCIDFQMPTTSIRFKLSCIQDFRKQRIFAYYSFSKVKHCNWSYLDSELQPHCLHFKQLSLPECTYDNIKLLEGGSKHLHTSSVGWSRSCEVLRKKPMLGVLRKPRSVNRSWPSSNSSLNLGTLPPFALSFTAAPTFFLSLHLKLLMERSITSISLQDHNTVYSLDCSSDTSRSVPDEWTLVEEPSENSPRSTPTRNPRTLAEDACSGLTCRKLQLGTEVDSLSTRGGLMKSSQNLINGKLDVTGTSTCRKVPGNTVVDTSVKSVNRGGSDLRPEKFVTLLRPAIPNDHAPPVMSTTRCYSDLNGMSVEIPVCDQLDRDIERRHGTPQVSDLAWNSSDGNVCSPNPTAPRSLWPRNRFSPSMSSFGSLSHAWPEGKTDFIRNGFGNGPRKPRTQVQYTLPFGGPDFNSKHKIHTQNGLSYKRIRRANEKRTSDGTRGSRRNLELVACDANLLITHGDKGWRECGARVFLEVTDQNEWKLAVKLCGMTKYSHKVTQDLQPGSTNRYTHAMMWKGGKDWALEFPDRSQWMLFKEMHEECHNRNIRAASVKNIPIPGVRLIEEFDDYAAERPFLCSPKYFRQVETDVDMAMDPSHILYDMDSDDEEWIVKSRKSLQTQEDVCEMISDELFEKTMDMFEKVSYAQQCDHLTVDEIEDFEAGPSEVIKAIYEHWRQKRQRKGMALIRQLQPPLWERYQQQVKQWEQLTGKPITAPSSGSQETAPSAEKPPMFAFCLKPRGLEVPNKGSKHRPHKKYSVSVNNHTVFGDHDGPHSLGRRINGVPYGDERAVFPSNSHESSDVSPSLYASTRVYSPRDAVGHGYFSLNADASEWNHHPRLNRNNSKKIGSFSFSGNSKVVASCNQQRKTVKRNGVHRWNVDLPDWSSQNHQQLVPSYRHQIEQLGGPDLDEFRLRDASGAAKHALNMAKLKRERAQKLLYRADLAIHKAVSALMTAEAIKASYGDSNGDG